MHWMLLPYRRYAEFSGRSRRREYWMFMLFYVAVLIAMDAVLGTHDVVRGPGSFYYGTRLMEGGGTFGGVFWLGSVIPHLAVAVRRLHDQDRSGWLLLLMLIPFFGWFALLVLFCLDGTRGRNRYGPDPKDPGEASVFS